MARTRLAVFLAGGELVSAAGVEAGDNHGVEYVVVQAAEAEVRQGPEAGGAQVGQNVVVAGGGVVVGAAGPGAGYPDQPALLVGQGEEVQAVMVVFAGVVAPVGLPFAALGVDEGAVDQDYLPALPGDLLQGAVQARGLRGEQGDQFVAPAADGRLGHVVAAGHVGQTLVVTQHGQDDHRDSSGRQDPPAGPDHFQVTPQEIGEVVDGPRGQRQAALVDKRAGVLGVLFGFRHRIPTAAGGIPVTPASFSGRQIRSQAGGELAVGQFAQPLAVDESDQLPAQRFQLGPHTDVDSQRVADLPGHDRPGGLPHGGEDVLVVRRQHSFLHVRRSVRDQHHRSSAHLPRRRRDGGSLVGELCAHLLKNPLRDGELVPRGPHLRQLLGEQFLTFVQLGAPRGDPFQQLRIQHAPDPRRPPGRGGCEPTSWPWRER